ncbi:hepcidin isoform X2 [Rhinoderma darwinii]|uniref:hepcidin isoform X2 n=1 Tax=Rhinoderma darwinii TaxID=43563 RepID=UPI003F66A406
MALMVLAALSGLVVLTANCKDVGYKEASDVSVNPRSDISEVLVSPRALLTPRVRRSMLGICIFCCGCCKKMRGCGMCCMT